jgi:hypothetical protein
MPPSHLVGRLHPVEGLFREPHILIGVACSGCCSNSALCQRPLSPQPRRLSGGSRPGRGVVRKRAQGVCTRSLVFVVVRRGAGISRGGLQTETPTRRVRQHCLLKEKALWSVQTHRHQCSACLRVHGPGRRCCSTPTMATKDGVPAGLRGCCTRIGRGGGLRSGCRWAPCTQRSIPRRR